MYILQIIINGIILGGIYALCGIGMSLILGIVKLTNLAHGEYIIMGAYATAVLARLLRIDPVITLLLTIPFMFAVGYVFQRLLINHAMTRGEEPALLITFGLSIILKDGMLMLFSPDAHHITVKYTNLVISLAGMDISVLNLVLLAVSIAVIILLKLIIGKTHVGRAIRAVADDPDAAALSGINVPKTYAVAMGLAAATAAAAGLCVSMKWTYYPSSGGQYLLIAFVIVVIGGMGSVGGALRAGMFFGFMQVIGGANYGLLISYIFLIVVLVADNARRSGRLRWISRVFKRS